MLTAVDPGIGGVLVRGEKGTAKTTIVRALATLLPPVEVVAGDRFSVEIDAGEESPDGPFPADAPRERRPVRLVELPVGASEDRVIGSLDLEEVLAHGRAAVRPGLLAAAHRGVLYVDEVNLLHDHLVDLLLDAAATGRATVERDGVSLTHPAAFLLVGTMNPEEGELRPQLLDRFGLTVHVTASRDVGERTEVVRRRLAHDADPDAFAARFATDEDALRARLVEARARLGSIVLPDAELVRISALCAEVEVDGMRADVVLARTSVAHAAWRGADAVDASDVRAAARLALPHRRRRDPFDEPHLGDDELDEALRKADEAAAEEPEPPEGGPDDDGGGPPDDGGGPPDGGGGPGGGPGGGGGAPPPSSSAPPPETSNGSGAADSSQESPQESRPSEPSEPAGVPVGAPARTRLKARRFEVRGTGEGAPGRRSRARGRQGRVVRAVPDARDDTTLHVPATVLAAAGRGASVARGDLRHAVREGREGNLVLFCVDASGSMAARRRMCAVTGAVAALLRDAYQRRDRVGVVTFRGSSASVALPPTTSVHAAHARLHDLRTGGRTPLADGLRTARAVLRTERTRDARRRGLLVVLTDGRATSSGGLDAALEAARGLARDAGAAGRGASMSTVVVDCESGPVRLGLAGRIARVAGGSVVTLDELTGESVAGVVEQFRAS
ncbi:VWA domain-containing protein [Actinomycetospora aeridis]|uniref:Mg-protoporphyrin IX chelatase n=1 Tax=Actinomycetospora aeridis TaxID=3129231 RepID=A0ABU8NDA3_9PSEU